MRKRKFWGIVCASLLAITLVGCGSNNKEKSDENSSSSKKTTLSFTWWGSEVRHEAYQKAVKLYEKENPNVKIEVEFSSWDDYWKKLATKAASGEMPDVMQMDIAYNSQYGQKKQLADLTDLVGKGKAIDTTNIDQDFIDGYKLQDKLYGMPPTMNSMGMLISTNVMKEAGITIDYDNWTFDDWAKTVTAVHDKTGKYGMIDVNDCSVLLAYYLRTKGENLYKFADDGTPSLGFSEDSFVEFFQTFKDLVASGAMPTTDIVTNIKSFDESPFSLGQSGLVETWTNQYATYQDAAGDMPVSLQLPFDAKDTKALYYRASMFYSIAETSKHKKAAAKFIDFLVNDEDAAKLFGTERGVVANTKVLDVLKPNMSDVEKQTVEYLENISDIVGTPDPVYPLGASELSTSLNDLYSAVTYGQTTPKAAYTEFTKKAKEVFASNYE